MQRRILLAKVVAWIAIITAFAALLHLMPYAPSLTLEQFDRLKPGMATEDVEAILGKEHDRRTGPISFSSKVYAIPSFLDPPTDPESRASVTWMSDTIVIVVIYSPKSGLVEAQYKYATRIEQSFFENLRWRATRQWERWFP